jgi:hypothetical protein
MSASCLATRRLLGLHWRVDLYSVEVGCQLHVSCTEDCLGSTGEWTCTWCRLVVSFMSHAQKTGWAPLESRPVLGGGCMSASFLMHRRLFGLHWRVDMY